jgi:hypothetical protein
MESTELKVEGVEYSSGLVSDELMARDARRVLQWNTG